MNSVGLATIRRKGAAEPRQTSPSAAWDQ